mgnify:CR=1 FL=1
MNYSEIIFRPLDGAGGKIIRTIVPPYHIKDCRISRPEVIFRRYDKNKPLRSIFFQKTILLKSLFKTCCIFAVGIGNISGFIEVRTF